MADLTCWSCLQGKHTRCERSGSCCCSICHPVRYIESWRKLGLKADPSDVGPSPKRRAKDARVTARPPKPRRLSSRELAERRARAPKVERERRQERTWDHLTFHSDGQGQWTENEMHQLAAMRAEGAPWKAIEAVVGRGPHIRAAFSVWQRSGRLQEIRGQRGPYRKRKEAA